MPRPSLYTIFEGIAQDSGEGFEECDAVGRDGEELRGWVAHPGGGEASQQKEKD